MAQICSSCKNDPPTASNPFSLLPPNNPKTDIPLCNQISSLSSPSTAAALVCKRKAMGVSQQGYFCEYKFTPKVINHLFNADERWHV
mmetsp:Transcript_3375/g.12831  ORF Transcript_3375/g.12831 Transcript_3375/m.12831 type:complete len:87 (-) Transcript_3375:23-283(-)